MMRNRDRRVPEAVVILRKAIENEFEYAEIKDKPVSVYVGLKRTEGRQKIAEFGGEPVYRTLRKNIFSYRATDEFTRKEMGQSLFFKARGIAEAGEETQSDDLAERVRCLREHINGYAYSERSKGIRAGLAAERGKYKKIGELLYYVFDVSPRYETFRQL